jgi:hypothetical protein
MDLYLFRVLPTEFLILDLRIVTSYIMYSEALNASVGVCE